MKVTSFTRLQIISLYPIGPSECFKVLNAEVAEKVKELHSNGLVLYTYMYIWVTHLFHYDLYSSDCVNIHAATVNL